ncbi:MAG: hypothetical protein ACSLE5_14750 [Porticoccaceae bacterium]
MSKTILDTNVVAYLMKGGPLAEAYAPHVHHPQRLNTRQLFRLSHRS